MEGRPHTTGARFCERSGVLMEHCRSNAARQTALLETVQKLGFPELTAEDVKLKLKTVRTRCVAELAKAIKSEKKVMQAYMIFMGLNCFVSNKHIHPCVALAVHEPECQQRLFFTITFFTFID
jgi:hypothetical protein